MHIVRIQMQTPLPRGHPPLETQLPTIDAVWNWCEAQSRETSLIVRVILAHMAQPSTSAAAPLVERVAFSFDDFSNLRQATGAGIDAVQLDEILGFLASVQFRPEALGCGGVRLRQSALFDLVKAHSGSDHHWLICGGQWAFVLLEPAARHALCRIALASLAAEQTSHPGLVKEVGLAIFEEGMRRDGVPMTLDFLALDPDPGRHDHVMEVLASLEKAAVIESVVLTPLPPERATRATFSLGIRPTPDS
jgi:hypothetical protein